MTTYEYRVFSAALLYGVLTPIVNPDAYLSEDLWSKAIRDTLAQGFRWVRTEGTGEGAFAIFERAFE